MDPNLKRAIILEHYQNPIGQGLIEAEGYRKGYLNHDSCIDEINMMVKLEDDIIKDIRFAGEACAIATSSTSIMINLLKNKSIKEAKKIITNFENMINEKPYDKDLLQEAIVYDEIYKQPARINCALLGWHCLKKIID